MLAFVLLALRNGNAEDIMEELSDMKEIKEVHILFGEWDILAKINVHDSDELSTFIIQKIRTIEGVKMTSTLIAAK